MNPPSTKKPKLPLPKRWPTGVQFAVPHVIGLAHTVMTYTRGWAANNLNARIRNHPHHVWHMDPTTVPTALGFWAPWFPFALPQIWPFCWWLAIVIDPYSRQVLDIAVFNKVPTSTQIRACLARIIRRIGETPRYLITDKGVQFWCEGFKGWCKRRGIRPRFGAIGRYGSIALIERFIRSLKSEHLRKIRIPFRKEGLYWLLQTYRTWFNHHRGHQGLAGKTPAEQAGPVTVIPLRLEPRPRWAIPMGKDGSPVAVRLAKPLAMNVVPFEGYRHLPLVQLQLAA